MIAKSSLLFISHYTFGPVRSTSAVFGSIRPFSAHFGPLRLISVHCSIQTDPTYDDLDHDCVVLG